MKSHTYYDILGVSRDATLDEITTAKNALAKVYHPDANANKSIRLMKQETQKKTLTQRVFQKWGKYQKEETIRNQQIAKLSTQAVQYITALKMAGIPMDYWSSDAMNWILVRWGQKQSVDYHTLFSRYDDYVEETLSNSEKIRLKNQNKRFHHNLKKLLSYALKA